MGDEVGRLLKLPGTEKSGAFCGTSRIALDYPMEDFR